MTERFSDEVLERVLKAQHDGFVNGDGGTNAERRRAGYAAMRAVLEEHEATARLMFTCACGDEFDSMEQLAAHYEMGHGAGPSQEEIGYRDLAADGGLPEGRENKQQDRLQNAIDAIEMLYATRGWSDGFRERLRQILDDVKASDGSPR